jgi:hypothetical protein
VDRDTIESMNILLLDSDCRTAGRISALHSIHGLGIDENQELAHLSMACSSLIVSVYIYECSSVSYVTSSRTAPYIIFFCFLYDKFPSIPSYSVSISRYSSVSYMTSSFFLLNQSYFRKNVWQNSFTNNS